MQWLYLFKSADTSLRTQNPVNANAAELFFLIVILIVAVRDLLWRLGEEVWRIDLAYWAGQLVSLAFTVDGVAVACGHGRLCVIDVHMSVLHGGLVRHLDVGGSEHVAERVVQ